MKETKYMTTTTDVQGGPMESNQLLTAEEVAAQLRVPESWLYSSARNGTFPAVKVGRYVRFRQEDVTEWIRSGGGRDD